jgi:prepilin-type N-terminal cleavage/methylation domain-containing protein/prepilin-type processing-associated H-X9-DG protein
MKVPSRRLAFTLIELLVVIAIIAILIGLLLPAVQKVRAAAQRMTCQNNLKQLAIAVHTYHDANGFIPVNGPGCTFSSDSTNWSWLTRILPYIEQGNLYVTCGITKNAPFNANQTVIVTKVETFLCPSNMTGNGTPQTGDPDLGGLALGQTNYKGVCGSNWMWAGFLPRTVCSTCSPPNDTGNGLDQGNGIFYRFDGVDPSVLKAAGYSVGHGPIKMISIEDGTSNTLMIGEDVPSMNLWCSWPYGNHTVGTCALPPNYLQSDGTPFPSNQWWNVYSFRSKHSGGVNFAMADGSVRFISDTIALDLYHRLATYNGGEPVSLP